MKVCFRIFGEIEVDNDIYGLDINTSSKEIRTYEITANTIPEVMEDTVAVVLEHFRVRVETRVAKFRDFLGKQLDTVC